MSSCNLTPPITPNRRLFTCPLTISIATGDALVMNQYTSMYMYNLTLILSTHPSNTFISYCSIHCTYVHTCYIHVMYVYSRTKAKLGTSWYSLFMRVCVLILTIFPLNLTEQLRKTLPVYIHRHMPVCMPAAAQALLPIKFDGFRVELKASQ